MARKQAEDALRDRQRDIWLVHDSMEALTVDRDDIEVALASDSEEEVGEAVARDGATAGEDVVAPVPVPHDETSAASGTSVPLAGAAPPSTTSSRSFSDDAVCTGCHVCFEFVRGASPATCRCGCGLIHHLKADADYDELDDDSDAGFEWTDDDDDDESDFASD